jgi:geranylgeranyl diphosphate synthase type I
MGSTILPASEEVAVLLARARGTVEPALRSAVDGLHPDLARVAGYHCGWITADGAPAEHDGGKRLRAALTLLSAAAAGAPEQTALPGAVTVELVHAFSLLHDDIIDSDHTRHGRPAAWTVFGVGAAVLTGDALLTLAVRTIADTADTALLTRLTEVMAALCHGQAQDTRFERCTQVSIEDYLAMVAGKTAALLELSATAGATLAGASPRLVADLGRLGHHLGVAFQMTDDILGIWGDPALTGKPTSDIARRKKTLPVLAALAAGTTASRRLADVLLGTSGDLDAGTIDTCTQLIDAAGGRARAESEIRRHHTQALRILDDLRLPQQADRAWRQLAAYLLTRVR